MLIDSHPSLCTLVMHGLSQHSYMYIATYAGLETLTWGSEPTQEMGNYFFGLSYNWYIGIIMVLGYLVVK